MIQDLKLEFYSFINRIKNLVKLAATKINMIDPFLF